MDPALPSAALNDGSTQISNPSDSQEPSTTHPAPCPASDESTATRTENSNSQILASIPHPSVSLSPLSFITPLSSSAESVTQTAKKFEHLEGLDFSNLAKGEDPATLLSISDAPTSSSTELSSISTNSLPSLAGLPHSPAQAAASIPSATDTASMARASPKSNAETLRKIAPAPPIGTANLETAVNPVPVPGPVPAPASQPQPSKAHKRSRKTAAQKRPAKRRKAGVYDDDEDGIIKAGNSPSDDESDEFTLATTHTKSGRTINRPTVFVPQQDSTAAAPVSATGVTVSPTVASAGQKTTSPRKKRRIVRKGKEVNITCERCERGYSPASNAIVFCDECNGAWHQFCHDPPIEMEVVNVKESQWFCSECRPVEGGALPSSAGFQDGAAGDTTTAIAGPTVTTTVYDSSFLEAQNLVGGSEFTQTERLGYLSGLSHAALVNLLVRISDSNPELAIFPANLRDLRPSVFIAPSSTVKPLNPATSSSSQEQNTTTTTAPTNPSPLIPANTASQPTAKPPSHPTLTSITPITTHDHTSTPTISRVEDYDSDEDYFPEHRLYPKPGNGLRLPPDSIDLGILLEDPGCRTFSHALHGPAAKMRDEGGGLEVSVGVE